MKKFHKRLKSSRELLFWISILVLLILVWGVTGMSSQETEPPSKGYCNQATQQSLIPPTPPSSMQTTDDLHHGTIVNMPPSELTARVGFGISRSADPQVWARALNAGWFLDWSTQSRKSNQHPEYWQMVRLSPGCVYPSKEYISWLASNYPKQVWIIGNEPDVIWQDAITAEEYAHTYHDLYYLIKAADSQAQIAVAGVAQATPLRLAYLDQVLSTYMNAYGEQMPVDWWTVHGFVLREEHGSWGVEIPPGFTVEYGERYEVDDHASIDLFKKQILDFRIWMAKNGYRSQPLALTEFGILMPQDYGFPTELVQQYMRDTFSWLASATDETVGQPQDENLLVQRWAWFSLSDPFYPASDLAYLSSGRLTSLGETYRDFVSNYLP